MTEDYVDEQLIEFKEAFALFDRDGSGLIPTRVLGTIMRSLGICPTETEIADIIKEADPQKTGFINFENFYKVVSIKSRNTDCVDEIIEAFRVFDREGNGIITADELKHIMTSLGEKMTEDEADEMVREADIYGNGEIKYEEFVRVLAAL